MERSPLQIFADGNVYVHQPQSLDEHVTDVQQVLRNDAAMDRLSAQLRQELIQDLTDAEYFRGELRKLLDLDDEAAAGYSDAKLVAHLAVRLQQGTNDWEAIKRVTAVVDDIREGWSAEDLARHVRSALHPLSSDGAVVTATMPPVKAVRPAEQPQQPALSEITTPDLFKG